MAEKRKDEARRIREEQMKTEDRKRTDMKGGTAKNRMKEE